jgi:hypothetical protein
MKKIAVLLAAMAVMAGASAQVVVGLQGGYFQTNSVNSWNDDYLKSNTWLGGLQVGYMVTPKLYVGVMGGYMSLTNDTLRSVIDDTVMEGMTRIITNHRFLRVQSGWTVAPQVKYEIFKYGNMHFNLLLQGNIRSLGYINTTESYNSWRNNHEYIEMDPVDDSISYFSWGVSLRPTLTYEFSKHLNAELSLDFLSVGYVNEKTKYESQSHMVDGTEVPDVRTKSTLYAGLNTLMETLRWESPMLRLGFNYTF